MAISDKRRRFCEEYIICHSKREAAIRAGYKVTPGKSIGPLADQILADEDCKAYIEELNEEVRQRNNITKDTIIRDIIEVRDRCMQKVPVMVFDKVEKEFVQLQENGEGVWQFDATNALKACDMLAKHIGFYEADKGPIANVNILNAPNIDDVRRIKRMLDSDNE